MMERGERNDIDSMTGGGWYDNSTTVPGDDETWWWNAKVQKVIKAKKEANNMRNITKARGHRYIKTDIQYQQPRRG